MDFIEVIPNHFYLTLTILILWSFYSDPELVENAKWTLKI